MKRSTELRQRAVVLDLCQLTDSVGFCWRSLCAWVKVKEMVSAIGAVATQSSLVLGLARS